MFLGLVAAEDRNTNCFAATTSFELNLIHEGHSPFWSQVINSKIGVVREDHRITVGICIYYLGPVRVSERAADS